ncbi:MAG TPA: M23 family metallopeptidase [Bacteroidales bacterium]|nr:M23 family metallopeptidase [Bacteroidales bacterium]HPS74376.1 M23 family metallopeptidase [Bacteroidales bacterium]
MSKVKYRFNKKSLTFDRVHTTFRKRLLSFFTHLSTGVVFSAVVLVIAYNLVDSPKEKAQKREIEQLVLQYRILNDQLDRVSVIMKDLQDRDDNIYRVIFEAEPIPGPVREAGIGGIDRYEKLKGYTYSEIMTETSKKMDRILGQMYVQSKSYDEVFSMAKNKEKMLASIPAIQPIKNKDLRRVGSHFGMRLDPFYKVKKFHEGIDFTSVVGTPIFATGDGTVTEAGRNQGGYGNMIVINHGYSYRTVYAHLSRIFVRPGQKVQRGQVIGYVGNTGKSTSPHLHYEVRKNNVPVNPIYFFFNDLTPAQFEEMLTMSSEPSQTMD